MLRQIVELTSGGSKRVFDHHLNMFVPLVVRRRMIDYDGFVRRNGSGADLPGCDGSWRNCQETVVRFLRMYEEAA